jgi:hypothetical protein
VVELGEEEKKVLINNFIEFQVNIDTCLGNVNKWFKQNCLSLNIEKTLYIHFKVKNPQPIDINKFIGNNGISNNTYTKFLGLIVDNTLSWKPHIDHLVNKLSIAYYIIKSVKPYVSTNAIITIYNSLFHAVIIMV